MWVEESLHFGGGRSTSTARNLVANSNVVAHSESGEDVVILEGVAEEVTDPTLQERIDDAYETKYGIRHGTPAGVGTQAARGSRVEPLSCERDPLDLSAK